MPNARTNFEQFLKRKPLQKEKDNHVQSVLLVDEVDVFFTDHFYGITYKPAVILDRTFPLIKRVWTERASIASVEEVMAFKEMQDCLKIYPNLNQRDSTKGVTFIEREI